MLSGWSDLVESWWQAAIRAHSSYTRKKRMIIFEQEVGRKIRSLALWPRFYSLFDGPLLGKWLSLFETFELSCSMVGGHSWPHIAPKCSLTAPWGAEVGGWQAEGPTALHGQSFHVLRLTTHAPWLSTHPGQCQPAARKQQRQQSGVPAQAPCPAGREEAGDRSVQAWAQRTAEKGQHPSYIRDR